MKLIKCADYDEMSRKAAELVAESLDGQGEKLISFPAGDTPLGMVQRFVAMANEKKINLSSVRYVSLDEWVGLGRDDKGSCAEFNYANLIGKLQQPFCDYFIVNGKADDLNAECGRLDAYIEQYGPIDVSVLGIGLNGHLGFNEDGIDFSLNAHIVPLSETTKRIMGKYFDRERNPEKGISQGIKQIMAAKKIILIANGSHKADILKQALYGPVTNAAPASILQNHKNCFVVVDELAAEKL